MPDTLYEEAQAATAPSRFRTLAVTALMPTVVGTLRRFSPIGPIPAWTSMSAS
jgi:hypothetical protein